MLASAGGFLRRHLWLIVIIIAVIAAALPILTYPLGRDQGEFATIGRGILGHRIPYVDLWNPKPPAVFYVYALAISLFGQTAVAIRLMDLLIAPVILWAAYWLGKRLAGDPVRSQRAGLFSALLIGVFYFTETFWTLSQNDGIVLLPMLLAMVCAVSAAERAGEQRKSWPSSLAAGTLCGLAIWFKYPFALFALALAGTYTLLLGRIYWRDVFAFIAGNLLVFGGGAGHLAAIGAFEAWLQSAFVTSSYTALGLNWNDFSEALRVAMDYRWLHWGLLFILAPVGVMVVFIHARRIKGNPDTPTAKVQANRAGWAMLLWLLIGFAMMAIQGKAYDYHWLPMLPPLALLGAAGLDGALAWIGGKGHMTVERTLTAASGIGLVAALGLVIWGGAFPYLSGAQDRLAYAQTFQAGEFIARESEEAAAYLRERVLPTDSLFIWGFRPEIYYLSELYPATRFIFNFPLVAPWYPEAWREENVDFLWAALPPYVIVAQADYMPWVTGTHEDSNTLLQSYEELNDWLIYNYEPEAQIGNLFLWRRKI
ncbi:MAG: glycosyltransferase family 39 protein [Anaerolineae bacterium]|nr:glycosyltransferase family 39 protein [Anaerolineae bacterium]